MTRTGLASSAVRRARGLALLLGLTLPAAGRADEPGAGLPQALAVAERALARVVEAEVPPVLVLAQLSSAQFGGAISMAMEGMRIVLGDMTEEQERAFEARWLPLFEHPSEELLAWLNRFNPLLAQFLAVRAALGDVTEALDAAGLEMLAAGEIGDAAAVEQALAVQRLYAALLAALNARLGRVADEIAALGSPPDVAAARRKARALHEAAFAPEEPLLRVEPAEVATGPRRPVEFRARVGAAPAGARLALDWRFSDGTTRRTAPEEVVRHSFFLDPARPEQSLEVALLDLGTNRVLARAQGRILVRPAAGDWVLVDRRTEVDPSTQGPRFRGSRLNRETGRREPIPEPPVNVFDGQAALADLTATTGWGNVAGSESASFRHGWDAPPPRLAPKSRVSFAVSVEGSEDGRLGVSEAPEGSTLAAWVFLPWGPSNTPRDLAAASARARASTRSQPLGTPERQASGRAEFEVPAPYVVGPKGEPLEPVGQVIELRVRARASFPRCSPSTLVVYRYGWDPTGTSLTPYGQEAPSPGAGPALEETAEQQAERRARAQRAFHEANAAWFRDRARETERALGAAADPETRNALTRDLLYQLDALQREQDAIQSLATGAFVRTRTDLDALNLQMMAEESRAQAEAWHTIRRAIERGPTLIAMAPPEDHDRLRAFFFEHVTSEAIASGDPERLRRVTSALGERVLGGLDQQAAALDLEAVSESEWVDWAQNMKDGADVSLMALSFLGGGSVYMVYLGGTGYLEGGAEEAVRRTASGYNAVTTIVNAGLEGYQRGVLENLAAYAQDPGRVRLDEQRAGWTGAAWSAGQAAALMAAMRLGYAALDGGCPSNERLLAAARRQDARVRYFRARQADARTKIDVFQQRVRALAQAGRAREPRERIQRLRGDLEAAYRDVKTDYFAKLRINALGRAGDHKTLHAYNSVDRAHMKRVTAALERRMGDAGFSEQRYRSFSNSSSKGKAGMDADIGAVEPARYVTRGGERVRNPEHVAWERAITQRLPDGTVVRRSPQQLQERGQAELEAAFKEVFGRPPGEAMVAFTTTFHPEAYRDVAWLGRKGLKTAVVHETDPRWTQQAADVTRFKVSHLPKEHPSLGAYGHLQEQCRGLVKDFDTKLAPTLAHARNPEAIRHLQELRGVMHRFATDDLGPVEAERRLRLLTGGEGITGVVDRFEIMLRGGRSLLPPPR